MITVTKTYLPLLSEYIKYLKKIWESNWVTNNGSLVIELERKLKDFLGVKNLFFVSNGTIALQIAIKALGIRGEIITTPFSYVASTSSIVWENCKPIFVDINPETLCIDTKKIIPAITKKTQAILAVHVYGNICDVEEIRKIAKQYKLKVIYDAAHAFGVTYNGISILNYGDISSLSFHATKVFHTVEGGALITKDNKLGKRISYMRNFGHKGEEDFFGLGINGKNSEFHAAMGLCVLPAIRKHIKKRKDISLLYDKLLQNSSLHRPKISKRLRPNYSYYPVIFESEKQLKKTRNNLHKNNIKPRRYFFPSLTSLNYVDKYSCPVAEDIARRVLCLPIYESLSKEDVKEISRIVLKSLN